MHCVDLIAGKAFEQAIIDHRTGASEAFLAGLKQQIHGAIKINPQNTQNSCSLIACWMPTVASAITTNSFIYLT